MRSPEELITRFREEGKKVTSQRLAVFEALHGDESHPTADVVWERVRQEMPTVSLRTVYQVLNDLTEMGEVDTVDVGNGAVRFDPNLADHDHFVCRRCEQVHDVMSTRPRLVSSFPGNESDDDPRHQNDDASAQYPARQYQVEDAEVIFRGLCPNCGT